MITNEHIFQKPIITEISLATTFYQAEDYHQNYFSRNQFRPFYTFVIQPKWISLLQTLKTN
ncbi:peptide-methionine (S)-S-oxide reductase [Pedobacter sp. N23S346]|uniref:peptide-methionine (S)-S-oxide reductase n=1 Tax=Pedobacter sp. N23S346 TaxID=3402750 RepID=UPI003AC76B4A